jgi:hypothetical protein
MTIFEILKFEELGLELPGTADAMLAASKAAYQKELFFSMAIIRNAIDSLNESLEAMSAEYYHLTLDEQLGEDDGL